MNRAAESGDGGREAGLWARFAAAMPLPAAAWALDEHGALLLTAANPAASRLAGVDLGARVGQSFTELVAASTPSTLADALARVAHAQEAAHLAPVVTHDGRAFAADLIPLGPGAVGAVLSEIAALRAVVVPPEAVVAPPASPPPPSVPRSGNILIIDDEPLVGRLVERALGRGHRVTAVVTGREGLELLEAGARYDLILCDLMMPEMTGMDLYDHVVTLSTEQAGRMVFLTGGAFTRRARDFLEARPFMEKPFDLSALEDLVKKRLGDA